METNLNIRFFTPGVASVYRRARGKDGRAGEPGRHRGGRFLPGMWFIGR